MSPLRPIKSDANDNSQVPQWAAGNSFCPAPICSLVELHNEFLLSSERGLGDV